MASETSRPPAEEWKWRRREVIIRDDYTCQECGVHGGPEGDAELHAHHKTPVAQGGEDDPENLVTLCKDCHLERHHGEEEDSENHRCADSLRNPNRDEESGRYRETYPVSEFLDALEELGGTAGTQEVADRVGCAYRTAYEKLSQLEEAGEIDSRKVGNARLWMLAEE